MSDYRTDIKNICDLNSDIRQRIVDLYLCYYDGSSEGQVLADLHDKKEVLLLYHNYSVVGFTTLQVYLHEWLNRKVRVVYSGDTIVDRAHWGQQALAYRWIERMGQIKSEKPDTPLYWFVIIKGHRTFKYLPTFSKSFYPHWAIHRSDLKLLADSLAMEKYGELYNKKTGIVEFVESRGHLKKEIAYPTEGEMSKKSVQFFLTKNPNYLIGHELVCICELEEENMKPLTKRIYRKAYDQILEATV